MEVAVLLSIGHSNHPFEPFSGLLKEAGVTVVADVRTRPFSRFVPAYNQHALKVSLENEGIDYIFMGEALGGKRGGSYHQRVALPEFKKGIKALLATASDRATAMMCAERHPLDCHRCRLIGRYLLTQGQDVRHILSDGTQVLQSTLESQLLSGVEADLFSTAEERRDRAYARKR